MRSSVIFVLVFIFTSFSVPAVAFASASDVPVESVPVVAINDFQVGRSWIWDYFDPNEQIYSTERYSILNISGTTLVIEMSSSYNGSGEFQAHHRLVVDLSKCLAAYKNRVQKKPWRFEMYYLNQGKWKQTEPSNTLAFEEKFNCNPHVYSKPHEPYLTSFGEFEGQPVFMQKLWRRIESTWFVLAGSNKAVAAGKSFAGNPGEVYKMKLRAQTTP